MQFDIRRRLGLASLSLATTLMLGLAVLNPSGRPALAEGAAPSAADAAAAAEAAKAFTPAQRKAIEFIIKDYLVANPDVFLEIQQALETKMEKLQSEKLKVAITENAAEIFRKSDAALAGNEKGDVTVVEFFDYNCGYCKRSFPSMTKLIASDPKLKVVFKELPILSKGSEEASRVALAARIQGKYWEAHRAIFEIKGPIGEASALKAVEKLGLDMAKLKADMAGPVVTAELAKTKELAAKMGINGTPHFLVGDYSIPGAPENLIELINNHVAELRKTGCSVC